jgi:transposase
MGKHQNCKLVAEICECSLSHVQSTWRKYKKGGIDAIKPKKMGRPINSGKLNKEQQSEIAKLITDNCPDQLKMEGFLWDRKKIKLLIKQKYGITITLQAISVYLKKWGFSAQRPCIKNYKQQPEEVKKWLPKCSELSQRFCTHWANAHPSVW